MRQKNAKNVALALLARREHSRQELREKLKWRNFVAEDVEEVLKDLVVAGWQSDRRFAESYAQMRIHRGYGPYRIQMELRERGVSHEEIASVLDCYDHAFWQAQIQQVYQKKFGRKPTKTSSEQIKQIKFLQYRGFIIEHIHEYFSHTSRVFGIF